MVRALELEARLVVRDALGLPDELGAVRVDILGVEPRELGPLEVVRELGGGARDVLLVALAHDAAVQVGDCGRL